MSDWVEVELEDDPHRSRAGRRSPLASSRAESPVPGGDVAPIGDRRGRHPALLGVVAAGGVAVGAVLGWMITASDDDDQVSGAGTTVAPSTVAATTEPGPTLPAVRPPRPTTTTEPLHEITELGGPVLPTPAGLVLVGLSFDGDLQTLELDTGRVHEINVVGVYTGNGYVVPGAARTLIGAGDGRQSWIVTANGDVTRAGAALESWGPAVPGDLPDSAWIHRADVDTMTPALELVSFDGETLAGPFDLGGGWPMWSDFRGGVLVDAPGGVYDFHADGASRLTEGQVLAVGVNHVIVRECDQTLQCSTSMIERDTGARSNPPPAFPDSDSELVWGIESIAPDGAGMVAHGSTGPTFGLRYVDFASGESVDLGDASGPAAVAWTRDGRYVLALLGLDLTAVDRTTMTSVELGDRIPSFSAFVAVPAPAPA